MRFRNAIFAGGGSRCFWQLGFWEGAKEAGLDLQRSVKFVGSTSAGCAMATAAVIDRAHEALSLFQGFTEKNPKNIHWWNLHPFRDGRLFPHAAMYRAALDEFVGPDDLRIINKSSVHFLMSSYPKWLRGALGATAALSIYAMETTLRGDPLHPRWPAKLGFTPLVGRASDCHTLRDYIDMVLAASCVPPVLPEGRFRDRKVLDGGLIENIPVRLAADQPGNTLVLASRRYDHELPSTKRVTWVQPSEPIKIDKFDYANPEGLRETFDLGLRDGREFGRSCVSTGEAYSSAQ
ncbi:MAG: patatin-like phospholipase family protein [Myxococcales bacterium]|nr:MAG: patatin-like phospholipase family protein [Myxococcales bacterium]